MRLLGVASCLLYDRRTCSSLCCELQTANGPWKVNSGTTQVEEKCAHASDSDSCVWDEASVVGGYKRMEARVVQVRREVLTWNSRLLNLRLSGSGRLPYSWIVEERG